MLHNLLSIPFEELQAGIIAIGEKPFRAKQIWQWIYVKGVKSFDEMTNLPTPLKLALKEKFTLERAIISRELISFDETRKWLLKFCDGNEIETVYIPEESRGTLCISSQVGCTLTCSFCHTGTQMLVRNLEAHEIVAQFLLAKDSLLDWPADKPARKLTNIVMMWMGEPLLNFDNVSTALKIIMNKDGLNISKRRITLSTSGVVPMIEVCGSELGVNLAISLHATRNELRNTLVPLNKKYPLEQLIAACRSYPALQKERRITFEYVMLDGVNDTDQDAKDLIKLIKGIPAKVNLIPFNPWPGTNYRCSTPDRIASFASIIERAGYKSPVRTPRGQDILAACGQLKSESMRERKKQHNHA